MIASAGPSLLRNGELIGRRLGFSSSWAGLVMIATVTSLPELATGISAVTVAGNPDIALGDVMGSLMFNLLIFALIDVLCRDQPLYRILEPGHVLSAAFGIVLIGVAAAFMLLGERIPPLWKTHIGVYSLILPILYFISVRSISKREHAPVGNQTSDLAGQPMQYGGWQLLRNYSVAAAIVVAAGIWLPLVAEQLATRMEWHSSFVGTTFVAAATSLPELIVTIAAIRMGNPNIAAANLLGSNLFDILIIAADDAAFTGGPILSHISPAHIFSALVAIVMTALIIAGLSYRPQLRLLNAMSWVGFCLIATYLLGSYLVYTYP